MRDTDSKLFIPVLVALFAIMTGAADARDPGTIVVTPLIPGTSIADPRHPSLIYQPAGDGTTDIYQTIPGTQLRDPYAPAYRVEHPDYRPAYDPDYTPGD